MSNIKNISINGKVIIDDNDSYQNVLQHSKKRLASKDLPKSIRLPLDTHSAISTIANIENKKMHEVVTDIVEEYIQNLPPQNKKLIRNNVEAIKQSSNFKGDSND